ncbi:hypothetical protein GCM10022216_16980 [Sphingobacterium kyonggiense]|uniref:Uncharacterized protein n=1 Tax=Sphingobacterium kyonggiense TaxID=714075 RepID=A0ABP7YP58_9SPHI
MIMDNITAKGTATSTGKNSRKNGTAINASPKPKVDRTNEARKLMIRMKITVKTGFS